ncbi:hypothetical protein RHECNPAF_730023 [Rhizobium etli CNPAF512]|nr:hypothetical protein RHECNPAF_730023 [Rhizobium etli CNPAF512]
MLTMRYGCTASNCEIIAVASSRTRSAFSGSSRASSSALTRIASAILFDSTANCIFPSTRASRAVSSSVRAISTKISSRSSIVRSLIILVFSSMSLTPKRRGTLIELIEPRSPES